MKTFLKQKEIFNIIVDKGRNKVLKLIGKVDYDD